MPRHVTPRDPLKSHRRRLIERFASSNIVFDSRSVRDAKRTRESLRHALHCSGFFATGQDRCELRGWSAEAAQHDSARHLARQLARISASTTTTVSAPRTRASSRDRDIRSRLKRLCQGQPANIVARKLTSERDHHIRLANFKTEYRSYAGFRAARRSRCKNQFQPRSFCQKTTPARNKTKITTDSCSSKARRRASEIRRQLHSFHSR